MIKRLLLLTLGLCSVVTASPLRSEIYMQNNGGLYDHISPLLVDKTHASAIDNVTLDDRGQLSKRNGYTVVQSTFGMLGFSTWTVTGGAFHKASAGPDFFAVVVGTAVYRATTAFSSYTAISGTGVNATTITATTTNLAQATQLQDSVVFCNEVDKPFYVQATGNAQAISTSTFSAAKTCATYGAYLVAANTAESSTAFPNRVRWSDINNINSFPPLNYIDVEPDNGDAIVGLVAFDESVYIFKKYSIYRMLITGQDGPDAFIIRPVARNIGAWSKNSIKAIPNVGVIFLSQSVAYLLSDSGLSPIGDKIQRTFDTVQRSMWANAVAEVYPKKYQYWLAVSTAGSVNTEVLVYDYIQSAWTIYDNMNVAMLAQAEDNTGKPLLISGDYTASTFKQDTGSADSLRGTSSAISAAYTTPNFTISSPDITKNFKYLYVYAVGDSNYTLTVKAAYDFSNTYEYTQSVAVGSSSAFYDTGLYDAASALYPASGMSFVRLELNRSAKAIRLQFLNSTSGEAFGLIGWTLVYSPEDYTQ